MWAIMCVCHHVCHTQAGSCLSTGRALNRCFAWFFGTVAVLAQGGGGVRGKGGRIESGEQQGSLNGCLHTVHPDGPNLQAHVPPPPLSKLRPCLSYSGRRNRITSVPNLIRYEM